MHFVLHNDKANNLGLLTAPVRQGPNFPGRTGADRPRFWAKTGASSRRWMTTCGSTSGPHKISSCVRTIEKNEQHRVAGNLYNIEVIVKYEIENFKDQAVTLDVAESLRQIRSEVFRDTGRDVEWELGRETTFEGRAGRREEHVRQEKSSMLNCPLAAPIPRPRRSCTNSISLIKNEW